MSAPLWLLDRDTARPPYDLRPLLTLLVVGYLIARMVLR